MSPAVQLRFKQVDVRHVNQGFGFDAERCHEFVSDRLTFLGGLILSQDDLELEEDAESDNVIEMQTGLTNVNGLATLFDHATDSNAARKRFMK